MKRLNEQTSEYLQSLRSELDSMVTAQYPNMDMRRNDMVSVCREHGFDVTMQTLDTFRSKLQSLTETETDRHFAEMQAVKAEAKAMKSKPVSFKVGDTVRMMNRGDSVTGVVTDRSKSGKMVWLNGQLQPGHVVEVIK